MKEEEYQPTIDGLSQLKDALQYWGKIIQRQSKIKFIRSARKISSDPEYKDAAAKEEQFIESEKRKYQQTEDLSLHEVNAEKLKIA